MTGSKPRRGKSARQLATVYPSAAGIDVGATAHVVAVPPDCDERPVRTFRTFSGDLHHLAQWLMEVGITTIAMESTGVYWVPVFENPRGTWLRGTAGECARRQECSGP